MATTVDERSEGLPDDYRHVVVTRDEVWAELDQEAAALRPDGRRVSTHIPESAGAVPRRSELQVAVPHS